MRILFLTLLLAPAAFAADFAIRPTPSWVERADVREAKESDVRGGVYAMLTDHQARVDGASLTDYYRRVRRVVTPAGVQNASELSIDFDPSFERLVIHDAALVRNGERINELDPAGVRIIEKESDQSDRIYDGELTALLFLKDVRPGDVIDYAYSLEGANPLLGGKYADEYELSASLPSGWIRHRLIWPSSRPLHFRAMEPRLHPGASPVKAGAPSSRAGAPSSGAPLVPRVEHRGGTDVYTWERRNVAATDDEDETPSWFDPYDIVQLTELNSWNEVARWADALFQPDAASLDAVAKLAERIRRENKTDDARITAAIRFVQDDIRYLGIEMGRNSHEPHQPAETLEQRFGDCKDKTFLLSLLLTELGLDARPAMVNTRLRHRLDDYLPSPFVFDHVITQVKVDDATYWIDGTIADQGGHLETIETPNDERALVVRDTTQSLSRIITRTHGSVAIAQTFNVHDNSAATTMTVRTTYAGREADDLRARLASTSIADLAKDHLNRYAADQPKIEAFGAPQVRDDRDANTIVVTERYRMRDLLAGGHWTYTPRQIEHFLKRPETMIRRTPLAFDYPLDITQTATFTLPSRVASAADHQIHHTAAFELERGVSPSGRRVELTYRLRAQHDAVSVNEVPQHLTALNDLNEHLAYTITPRPALASAAEWSGGIIALLLLLVLGVRASGPRRAGLRPARDSHAGPEVH